MRMLLLLKQMLVMMQVMLMLVEMMVMMMMVQLVRLRRAEYFLFDQGHGGTLQAFRSARLKLFQHAADVRRHVLGHYTLRSLSLSRSLNCLTLSLSHARTFSRGFKFVANACFYFCLLFFSSNFRTVSQVGNNILLFFVNNFAYFFWFR